MPRRTGFPCRGRTGPRNSLQSSKWRGRRGCLHTPSSPSSPGRISQGRGPRYSRCRAAVFGSVRPAGPALAALPVSPAASRPTRSQNITVTCLRSPEAPTTGGCGIAATEGVDADLGLSVAVSDTSLRSAIARRIFLRSPSTTPRSFRSWSVRSLRTENQSGFCAKRWSVL